MKAKLTDLSPALKYDPFAGDTDGDVTLLSDKIVTARKDAKCHNCSYTITSGMRIRSRCEKFDGAFMTYKWCEKCTEFMAINDDDALEAAAANRRKKP